MASILVSTVRSLQRLSHSEIVRVIRNESSRLEITKSLLALLYNICLDKSVPLSVSLKEKFKAYNSLVLRLLKGVHRSVNRTAGIAAKRSLLLKNPQFVRILSKACPVKLGE